MLNFNHLLNEVGLSLNDVKLLRHQDTRYSGSASPYVMWRDDRDRFEAYQQTQSFGNRSTLDVTYWAAFVGMPNKGTIFAGLYRVLDRFPLSNDRRHPADGSVELAGSCDFYTLEHCEQMLPMEGRLLIEWGVGYRSWIQRADRQAKPIIELRQEFKEPEFPGFSQFIVKLSDIETMPAGWSAVLGSTRGIYLLTCPRTKEQYVGSASGVGGFIGRWRDYATTGHGGNVALRSRDASDYQISILETVGSNATETNILALESLWKQKLQSREMGLNRN